jgi:hypothetical protein
MTGTGIIARAALMGTALVLGSSVLGPSAWADSLVFDLNQSNLGAGFTGPFAQVEVDRTSTTTATFTFDSLTNGGFIYLFHSNGGVGVNVDAATFTVGSISATNSLSGFTAPSASFGGARNEDGFGSFNATIDLADGFKQSATEITFTVTNTSGTWANVASVLTPNNNGNIAAAQIGACLVVCNGTTSEFTNTGFASGFAAVPSPIVGAGLPGIVLACGGVLALARRRRQLVA